MNLGNLRRSTAHLPDNTEVLVADDAGMQYPVKSVKKCRFRNKKSTKEEPHVAPKKLDAGYVELSQPVLVVSAKK